MTVVIVGAGPAGLTAALELQAAGKTDVVVLEADSLVGGISRTVDHNGNRIDIGGHRFFSKSDWVMQWWAALLPVESGTACAGLNLQYKGQSRDTLPDHTKSPSDDVDEVMLLRSRLSRIYYNRQFFDYPLKLNFDSLRKLGALKTVVFGFSYVAARLKPIQPERSLEDFLINRFGAKLYRQFFKEYTEKVWGVPCNEISAAWGAQRIKSLSVTKALLHAARQMLGLGGDRAEQTSLIESFLYPKYGPGQMWEVAARRFVENGGRLIMEARVTEIEIEHGMARSVTYVKGGREIAVQASHVISTMPVRDLVFASSSAWPEHVVSIARDLAYRDFITVGLLYPRAALPRPLDDNWIYVQEPGVKVGRVQVFNNWSPFMVASPDTVWLGLEFFCRETDELWHMDDHELIALAQREMLDIGLVSVRQTLDSVVIRVPKAYPGYFGAAYDRFDELRGALDSIENLFLVGRNGMHRYNNQDHSMLTAREAARQIAHGEVDKSKIWAINIDDEYHEEKAA
ncbi:hypothetical protein GCM10008101_00550 [Lysobacter xinjiangensis]|uniref:Amine oxidase domain-containing protein n=1 Tax=Cognatilysobacter xinjiangensis TaxID=546892 RepID=A0ABQ3BQV8_9GAMM|nr:NAD(P)/FAD-dependent oxidoreductase [Lysobacter xinjiangensis]GGZ51467.1 hypothetical protein GCM10008101_00550 [Lysobacter xinjiangensis]